MIATYVIETVKENMEACGGKTHVGFIRPREYGDEPATIESFMLHTPDFTSFCNGEIAIFSDDYVKKMADSISEISSELKGKRNELVFNMLRTQAEKCSKRAMEGLTLWMKKLDKIHS